MCFEIFAILIIGIIGFVNIFISIYVSRPEMIFIGICDLCVSMMIYGYEKRIKDLKTQRKKLADELATLLAKETMEEDITKEN